MPANLRALEAQLLAAPDDMFARRVYGDLLGEHGLGDADWMALAASVEDAPADVRLRSALVAHLDSRRVRLLGKDGAKLLARCWFGWRGGLLDEARLQYGDGGKDTRFSARQTADLLAQPASRFVRTIGVGTFREPQPIFDAIAAAAPPLLEHLVAFDAPVVGLPTAATIDPILRACTLRGLGLRGVEVSVPAPAVTTLVLASPNPRYVAWLLAANAPAVTELVLDGVSFDWPQFARALAALPALRRLRLLGVPDAAGCLRAIDPSTLELLDLSHTGLSAADVGGRVIAHGGPRQTTLARLEDDRGAPSWLSRELANPTLRLIPGLGLALYNLGTFRVIGKDPAGGLPLLAAALTRPSPHVGLAWANAAIAHERLGQLDEAELLAREGLLHAPGEPNFYAILLDALRRTNRLDQAIALVPRAFEALDARARASQSAASANACLGDCLLTLAQAGRHADALAAAKRYAALVTPDHQPVLAIAHLALGKRVAAERALAAATTKLPVLHHARAVLALPDQRAALAHLRALRKAAYPEWHWIATDPLLAPLHGTKAFLALTDPPRKR